MFENDFMISAYDADYLHDTESGWNVSFGMNEGDFSPLSAGEEAYILGDPTLLDCIHQSADNCAVEAERAIINQFISDPISQEEAMFISAENGWYNPGNGTHPDYIGNMMELYGIENHTVVNASIQDLAAELANGHGVIVGVDSEELWDSGPLADIKQAISSLTGIDFGDTSANHAIVVTGIDVTDPASPCVIVNDSGRGDKGISYPLEKFLQAWEDSGFYYTATNSPMPGNGILGDIQRFVHGTGGYSPSIEPALASYSQWHTSTDLLESLFSDPDIISTI